MESAYEFYIHIYVFLGSFFFLQLIGKIASNCQILKSKYNFIIKFN